MQVNETSWIVGFVVGGVVVLVVVAVVLTIIKLATDIRDAAVRIIGDLERAEAATAPLWQVDTTRQVAIDTLAAARRAGDALPR